MRVLGCWILKSGGPWFKSSTLLLSGFVFGSPDQLGFLIVSALFAIIFSYLFTVSPISTTVLNTLLSLSLLLFKLLPFILNYCLAF